MTGRQVFLARVERERAGESEKGQIMKQEKTAGDKRETSGEQERRRQMDGRTEGRRGRGGARAEGKLKTSWMLLTVLFAGVGYIHHITHWDARVQ